MNKVLIKKIFFFLFSFVLFMYLFLVLVLPFVCNTKGFSDALKNDVLNYFNLVLDVNNLSVKSHFNLSYDIYIDKLSIDSKNNKNIVASDNILIKVKPFTIKEISCDYLYFNQNELRSIKSNKSDNRKAKFDIHQIPSAFVKKADLQLFNNNKKFNFYIKNFTLHKKKSNILCRLNATISSKYLKSNIQILSDGYLIINQNQINADNFRIKIGKSFITLNGKILDKDKTSSLKITGKSLPAHDIEAFITYFLKLKNGGKVFLENFYDFSGLLDIDLLFKNNNIYGNIIAHRLGAKSVIFNVPILFPIAKFIFDGKIMYSEAYGTLGGEKVYNAVYLQNLFSENYQASGRVSAVLTNNVVSSYIPNTRLSGNADTSIRYSVKNKKIDISYLIKLNSGSDLYYKDANLGLYNFNRRVFVKTTKEKDKISLTHYDYSLIDGSNITNIITGDALFQKKNGIFKPQYINCKTNGYAPVSVTGSFGKYVEGGFFNGNLKYDCVRQKLLGSFYVIESKYKDFFVNKASVVATDEIMKIEATGKYDESPYSCNVVAENDFSKKIRIYNMDLFLDKFIIKSSKNLNNHRIMVPDVAKDFDIFIDNWKVKLNKLSYHRFIVNNVFAFGKVQNNIFNFQSNNVSFAKGYFNANGWYDFKNHSSCIDFKADNIDSNIVADVAFGLRNQISGLTSADFHLESKNGLDNINGCAKFSLKDGYLTNLGNTAFLVKNSRHFKHSFSVKLSNLTNLDISNPKVFASDINGYFTINNNIVENIKLTSKQKYLSLFIEGKYDIDRENADLQLWGKYNKKAQKGIKVLFVPLSLIVKAVFRPEKTKILYKNKLDMVPDVVSNPDDIQPFRVKLKGNLNNSNLSIELKSIY